MDPVYGFAMLKDTSKMNLSPFHIKDNRQYVRCLSLAYRSLKPLVHNAANLVCYTVIGRVYHL